MKRIGLLCVILFSCAAPMDSMAPPSLISNITRGPNVIRFEWKKPKSIGKSKSGQEIFLGGLSGLRYLGRTSEGKYRFLSLTDRGPNPEPYEENGNTLRPFLLPQFQPRILYIEADPKAETMQVVKEILLTRADGKPISGIPQNSKQEIPVDVHGKKLPFDPEGMDLEGIVIDEDGSFWMVDEYGPSVVHFSPQGRLLELLRPERGLPVVLKKRRLNRGFEGVARHENSLFAMLQSPLDNPSSAGFANSKNSNLVRLLEIDLKTQSTMAQYVYPLENNKQIIGDIAIQERGKIFVIEQDGNAGADSNKKIFLANIKNASNLQLFSEKIMGPNGSLELMSAKDLRANQISAIQKQEIFDLAKIGVAEEKIEGIDLVDGSFLAIVADNDFGVGGTLDRSTGKVTDSDSNSALYLIAISKELD